MGQWSLPMRKSIFKSSILSKNLGIFLSLQEILNLQGIQELLNFFWSSKCALKWKKNLLFIRLEILLLIFCLDFLDVIISFIMIIIIFICIVTINWFIIFLIYKGFFCETHLTHVNILLVNYLHMTINEWIWLSFSLVEDNFLKWLSKP